MDWTCPRNVECLTYKELNGRSETSLRAPKWTQQQLAPAGINGHGLKPRKEVIAEQSRFAREYGLAVDTCGHISEAPPAQFEGGSCLWNSQFCQANRNFAAALLRMNLAGNPLQSRGTASIYSKSLRTAAVNAGVHA